MLGGGSLAVMIEWDEHKKRAEKASTSAQRLLPSLWDHTGRHRVGAWRFDIDVVK